MRGNKQQDMSLNYPKKSQEKNETDGEHLYENDLDIEGSIALFSVKFDAEMHSKTEEVPVRNVTCWIFIQERNAVEEDKKEAIWYDIVNQKEQLVPFNILSQLYRSVHEYRVWLHSCENGWEVVFPPFLMVPSYQSLSIEETYLNKLEVGTFVLSKKKYNSQLEDADLKLTFIKPYWVEFTSILIVFFAFLFFSKHKIWQGRQQHHKRTFTSQQLEITKKSIDLPIDHQKNQQQCISFPLIKVPIEPVSPTAKEQEEEITSNASGLQSVLPATTYIEEKDVGKLCEVHLLPPLPDVSDERAWREFFDSEIYQKTADNLKSTSLDNTSTRLPPKEAKKTITHRIVVHPSRKKTIEQEKEKVDHLQVSKDTNRYCDNSTTSYLNTKRIVAPVEIPRMIMTNTTSKIHQTIGNEDNDFEDFWEM